MRSDSDAPGLVFLIVPTLDFSLFLIIVGTFLYFLRIKKMAYDVVISKGFTALKPLTVTAPADKAILNFWHPVVDNSRGSARADGYFRLEPVG